LGTGASILIAYLLTNWLPFDSYSIAIDHRQVYILLLHYITLAMPFFFSGMALSLLLTKYPEQAGNTYAINMLGSAAGCLITMVAPAYLGGEGTVTLSALLAAIAVACVTGMHPFRHPLHLGATALIMLFALDLSLRLITQAGLSAFDLHISPYKSLSYALNYPGARVIYRQWNAFSRLDVVESAGIHSIPGLSYRYMEPIPQLNGLLVDGDELNPTIQEDTDSAFTAYLPSALAFQLRPHANTLILEPRGGLDILTAFSQGRGRLTVVESNPLIASAVHAYADQRLFLHQETERSYLQQSNEQFDVILLSLISSFHPVQSGAYSLAEDYRYTVESFREALKHLSPNGLFIATRWLQDPPSEDLRLFALAVEAIEAEGGNASLQIVAFRGYNTGTIVIRNDPYNTNELVTIRQFASERAFDLTYAPGIQEWETNLYNILLTSIYYQTYLDLLETSSREVFYETYAYDVKPPTDDHPFFGHYFKWSQTQEIFAQFGKVWLPFGGGGYLVILALLLLAGILAGVMILLPVGLWKLSSRLSQQESSHFKPNYLIYFGLLGFAFMFVEIPLLQRFILYLGNPAYSFTAVLFALLLFSGMGSRFSKHFSLPVSIAVLSLLIGGMLLFLPHLFEWTLGLPLAGRLGVTILALGPLGFLMGIPFPGGIHWLVSKSQSEMLKDDDTYRTDIPWIWAVNGAVSVISPILAALLALSFSFSMVVVLGAICYALACLTAWVSLHPKNFPRLGQ
jgi:hypothetical protein